MAEFEIANVIEYSDGEDPRKIVLDTILPLVKGLDIYRNEVLLVTAPNRTKSKGGILYVPKTQQEQRFQGKIGLIVGLGEIAFKDEELWPNEETRPVIGTWVFFRNADTNECSIGGYSCRFILDDKIRGRCPACDTVR